MHQACIPEQGYRELSIKTTVDSAGKDLMDQIIHYAMQEVVPWELKEQVLRRYDQPLPLLTEIGSPVVSTRRCPPGTAASDVHRGLGVLQVAPSLTSSRSDGNP